MTPLQDFRARLGPTPRPVDDWLGDRPDWVCEGDEVERVWARQTDVIRDGEPVLAWIVTANDDLWTPTPGLVAPAHVVYSLDPALRGSPQRLRRIAQAMQLQGAARPTLPDLRPWVRLLQDQVGNGYERVFHERVPRSLSNGWCVYHATVVVRSDHLPEGHLAEPVLPLVVGADCEGVALVPPADRWPQRLRS